MMEDARQASVEVGVGLAIGILRAQELGVVREIRDLEANCPNGRDYERPAEFDAAYQAWQERRAALERERAEIVRRYRLLYTDRFADRRKPGV